MIKSDAVNLIEVVIGIVCRGDQVLLSQRTKTQSHPGKLEFPGGKIESGESPIEALKREFTEEVGLLTFDWRFFEEIDWQYDDLYLKIKVYKTEGFKGIPKSLEGQNILWQAITELNADHFPEANAQLIQKLKRDDKDLQLV
jgi:8-oxo-dGTP diphosphatase